MAYLLRVVVRFRGVVLLRVVFFLAGVFFVVVRRPLHCATGTNAPCESLQFVPSNVKPNRPRGRPVVRFFVRRLLPPANAGSILTASAADTMGIPRPDNFPGLTNRKTVFLPFLTQHPALPPLMRLHAMAFALVTPANF